MMKAYSPSDAKAYSPSDALRRHKQFFHLNSSLETAKGLGVTNTSFEYYTCKEFEGEMNEYDRPEKYTIGELYFCSQMNIWNWLKNECKTLDQCPHPRIMPSWKYMDGTMKLHASLRRLLVLLLMFNEKYPNDFQFHLCGGSLLGLLRHGDIIPHDHDGDIILKNESHREFLYQHINELPDDIGIFHDKYSHGLMDMNGCMEDHGSRTAVYGPYIDLLLPSNLKYFLPDGVSWNWEQDVIPIQNLYYHDYVWPLPKNWPKLIAGDFKDGRRAYTYVPFKLDEGASHFTDKMCDIPGFNLINDERYLEPNYKWTVQDGMLKREKK